MKKKQEMSLREIVKRNVKTFRTEKGYTQAGLAKRAGLNVLYISRLESVDSQNITVDMLEKIAGALEIAPYELLVDKMIETAEENVELLEKAMRLLHSFHRRVKSV